MLAKYSIGKRQDKSKAHFYYIYTKILLQFAYLKKK